MYPIFRFMLEMRRARKLPPLAVGDTHVTKITCLPWDIDYQFEMNNGRILTLFDIGRVVMLDRLGIVKRLAALKWYGTIAGSTVRYRRRITLFQKLEMRSRVVGVDERFNYIEQSFWRDSDGECCAHAVLRVAITSGKGIIPSAEVIEKLEMHYDEMALPNWVKAWDASEQQRPWPPSKG
ncbi:MAG: acyl-CoA thioesterase [Silicimonas sp.]|nr:acyl-CoA thioesterase [Silicimonas sp.]